MTARQRLPKTSKTAATKYRAPFNIVTKDGLDETSQDFINFIMSADGQSVIEQKEREIEAMCMRLLLQQQPVAADLRVISSALKMVTDMERIGDNSGDIAEIITMANISNSGDTLNIRCSRASVCCKASGGAASWEKQERSAFISERCAQSSASAADISKRCAAWAIV